MSVTTATRRAPRALLLLVALTAATCASCEDSSGGGAATGGSGGAGGGTAVAGAPASGASSGGLPGSAGMGVTAGASSGGVAGLPSGMAGAPSGGANAAGSNAVGGVAGSVASSGSAGASAGGSTAGGTAGGGSGGAVGAGRFPFPQNVFSERCTYPMAKNPDDARRAYDRWKTEIVTAEGAGGFLRTRRPNSPGAEVNSTVSEGIAYGMILAVAMGDQPLFDALWQYSQLHLNENGLMHWYIGAQGNVLDNGGATDSDEDMAWALVMADRQWGGSGSLSKSYLEYAKTQIEAIWEFEVDHSRDDLLLAGDSWGSNVVFNPSYFAPNQYRIFGQVTGKVAEWNRVIDTGYEMLEKCLSTALGNEENGLAPAWCTPDGGLPSDLPQNYQYDSARVPFRIGQDYCYSGEPRAKAYLAKISRFFSGIGAANIVDGYALNGDPEPDPDAEMGGPQSAVFVGSAAVGAMHDAQFSKLAEDAYALVATGELLARSRYYNLSWTALSLLMLSGNLIEYPAPAP